LIESTAFGHYHLGMAAYYLAETAKAHFHLGAAVQKGRIVDPNTYLHANCALALSYQTENQAKKANEISRSLVEYAVEASNPTLLTIANALSAELALHQGRLSEAAKWAMDFPAGQPKQAVRFFVPQFTLAKILIAQGETTAFSKTQELLDQLQGFFTSIHNTHCLIEVLALKALLYDATGDHASALSDLEGALNLAKKSRRKRPFLDAGPQMAALLERLSRQGRFGDYINAILSAQDRHKALTPDQASSRRSYLAPKRPSDAAQALDEPLTNRELDIVHLLADRLSNKEIAEQLFISPGTVKSHTNSIYRKLAVRNRQQAIDKAKEIGLI
jgi:LuxR family maltose regulon positive regulatory protein